MSIELVLLSARDMIRSTLKIEDGFCGIQPGGRPPASMGEYYIALDEQNVESTEKVSLREVYGIEVTITKRTGSFARDSYDKIYTELAAGLGILERSVIAALHDNHNVRINANTLGGLPSLTAGDGFLQPLWYGGRARSMFKGGDWNASQNANDSFMVRVLPFRGALRIQNISVIH